MQAKRLVALLAALLLLGLLCTPLHAIAQVTGKVYRVGFLGPRVRADVAPYVDAFRQGRPATDDQTVLVLKAPVDVP